MGCRLAVLIGVAVLAGGLCACTSYPPHYGPGGYGYAGYDAYGGGYYGAFDEGLYGAFDGGYYGAFDGGYYGPAGGAFFHGGARGRNRRGDRVGVGRRPGRGFGGGQRPAWRGSGGGFRSSGGGQSHGGGGGHGSRGGGQARR